jgi:hypothetical protein
MSTKRKASDDEKEKQSKKQKGEEKGKKGM